MGEHARKKITGASDAIDAMKRSTIDVRLVADVDLSGGAGTELPWQRGRRLAALFRRTRSKNRESGSEADGEM